jgi:hypothetical protein
LEHQKFFYFDIPNLGTKIWKVESFNLLDFHISKPNIGNPKVFLLLVLWRIWRGRNFAFGTQNLVPKLSFVVFFQLNTPFLYPNHESVCLVCRKRPRNSQTSFL